MSNLTMEEKAVFSAKFEKSFNVAGPRILIRRAPIKQDKVGAIICLLYTSPSPRDELSDLV